MRCSLYYRSIFHLFFVVIAPGGVLILEPKSAVSGAMIETTPNLPTSSSPSSFSHPPLSLAHFFPA